MPLQRVWVVHAKTAVRSHFVILSVAKQSERECVGATRLKSQFFVNFGMLSAKATRYTIALYAYGLRHGYRLYRGISFRRHGTLCEQHDIFDFSDNL